MVIPGLCCQANATARALTSKLLAARWPPQRLGVLVQTAIDAFADQLLAVRVHETTLDSTLARYR